MKKEIKKEFLNPHKDWRIIAEGVKDYPLCKNCGEPYGNVYFGASHSCKKGYKPN